MRLTYACRENIGAVNVVLEEIDAHEIPALLVMNKIDMLDDFEPRIDRRRREQTDSDSGCLHRPGLALCHCFSVL